MVLRQTFSMGLITKHVSKVLLLLALCGCSRKNEVNAWKHFEANRSYYNKVVYFVLKSRRIAPPNEFPASWPCQKEFFDLDTKVEFTRFQKDMDNLALFKEIRTRNTGVNSNPLWIIFSISDDIYNDTVIYAEDDATLEDCMTHGNFSTKDSLPPRNWYIGHPDWN